MIANARFVHTNIIAQDWKRLARFYERVFGCMPVPPERHLAGEWLEAATGVPDARIRGIHLRLPGYGNEGPTLEIFQYIAFAVDDVEAARKAVLDAGGGNVGEVVSVEIAKAGAITFVYLTDPEGNIIELQHWSA
jgi:predicted enzyme related to lactoylglutathione lyase